MAATLRIRVGTSIDSMVVCNPNDEAHPIRIQSDSFDGYFLIRVHNFQGVVPDGATRIPTCKYFEGHRRLMSVQFQGRFKQPWTANDLVWSNDWEQPLKVPKMMGLFTKFLSVTDPGSFSDLKIDTPYMRSFAVTAMCTIAAWNPTAQDPKDEPFRLTLTEDVTTLLPSPDGPSIPSRGSSSASLTSEMSSVSLSDAPAAACGAKADEANRAAARGVAGGGGAASEPEEPTRDWKLIEKVKKGGEDGVTARRKFFASEANRKEAIFHPSKVYGFEVFNPYFDPNTFKTKIPAVTIDMKKMMRGQPLRTRLMTGDGRTVFLIVELSQEIDGDLDDEADE